MEAEGIARADLVRVRSDHMGILSAFFAAVDPERYPRLVVLGGSVEGYMAALLEDHGYDRRLEGRASTAYARP